MLYYAQLRHICELLYFECENGVNLGPTPIPHIDNKTACEDGYTHGWIQECLIDGGGACKPQPNPTTYTYAKCIAYGHDWLAGACQSVKGGAA